MGYDLIMKIQKHGSSLKQIAYARRVYGAEGTSKKQIALDVGYSPAVANSCISKIESRPGFNNAMAKLAQDSNNLVLKVMSELNARGFDEYSNKDLTAALNAITNAWSKFNDAGKPKDDDKDSKRKQDNKLRTVILQRIENQTVNTTKEEVLPVEEISGEDEEIIQDELDKLNDLEPDPNDPMDF